MIKKPIASWGVIEQVRISKASLAAKGFDPIYGAETHPSSDLHLKKAAADRAGTVIVTADGSSFLRYETINLLPWSHIHSIVTDQIPPMNMSGPYAAAASICFTISIM